MIWPLLLSICLCLCWVSDKLYSNNAAGAAAKDATDSVMGYGTFYPDSTYSTPPGTVATKGENYQTMPPPADQESPYSYGYGEEKKKMLTQNENQGGNYSMYSTAYPSSVTGNQGYNNNYGELVPSCVSLLPTFRSILGETNGTQLFSLTLQAGGISSPGGGSPVSACIRALEHKTRARTLDTATHIISQHKDSAHYGDFYATIDKNVLVPEAEKRVFVGSPPPTNVLLGCE